MGATLSAPESEVRQHIVSEFVKALPASRVGEPCAAYSLDVRSLLRLAQFEGYQYDFAHLPLLFMLDGDRDGRFTLYDLLNLGAYHGKVEQGTGLRTVEVPALVQALSTGMLGKALGAAQPLRRRRRGQGPSPDSAFINWLSGLIESIGGSYNVGLVRCVPSSSIDFFHGAFHIEHVTKEPARTLVANMQLAGMQMGLYGPQEAEEFRSSVPFVIVQEFAAFLLKGFTQLFTELDAGNVRIPRYERPFGPASPYVEEEFQAAYSEYARGYISQAESSGSD